MSTNIPLDVLDRIGVASPCSMRWEDLDGDAQMRHCGRCRLNVYNFSAMTRDEITTLVERHEGRLCGGFYRRPDGTILTRDCPVGVRAVRARVRRVAARIAAVVGVGLGAGVLAIEARGTRGRTLDPVATVRAKLAPASPFVMGEIMLTPPPVAPAAANPDE
ncbi:MAG: hypothetical protein HKO59_11690 [Phycisphaerales bacterium]|nr:hypothetical protein [Phycisphaerales bacterium]NNM26625.1 hypothetical protein [Phycisphaerales bacterium]